MNLESIKKRVEKIREEAWDDEAAHGDEDALHQDALLWISKYGDADSAALAKAVLATLDIEFQRWCA